MQTPASSSSSSSSSSSTSSTKETDVIVTVSGLDGVKRGIKIPGDSTLKQLREQLAKDQEKIGVQIRLIYKGEPLGDTSDEKACSSFSGEGDILHQVPFLSGR